MRAYGYRVGVTDRDSLTEYRGNGSRRNTRRFRAMTRRLRRSARRAANAEIRSL